MAAGETSIRLSKPVTHGALPVRRLHFRRPSIELLEQASAVHDLCEARGETNYVRAVALLAVATGLPTKVIEKLEADDIIAGVDHVSGIFDSITRRLEVAQ